MIRCKINNIYTVDSRCDLSLISYRGVYRVITDVFVYVYTTSMSTDGGFLLPGMDVII